MYVIMKFQTSMHVNHEDSDFNACDHEVYHRMDQAKYI